MTIKSVFAGFGGQGVLMMGYMLALTAMRQGKNVTYLPAYGAEVRGGTANCTVVISDRTVGSPVIQCPRAVVAMNLPSLEKFESSIKPGGLLLINSSLIAKEPGRTDVKVLKVPANDIANDLHNPKGANMVALGAYLGATHAVALEEMEALVRETFASKPKVVEANIAALRRGYELGEEGMK